MPVTYKEGVPQHEAEQPGFSNVSPDSPQAQGAKPVEIAADASKSRKPADKSRSSAEK